MPLVVEEIIGTSENGQNLTVRKFDLSNPTIKVFIQSRIHGDEEEGEDATGRFIASIDFDNCLGFIGDASVHILQVANPDGKTLSQRENANGLDLNRGYESVESKEMRAIHAYMRKFRPHVTIDVHAFPPTSTWMTGENIAFNHDVLIDFPTSPMCRRIPTNAQFTELLNKIRTENPSYTYDRYVNSDSTGRTRFSTEDIQDNRNGPAFRYDCLSFLFEGRESRADETPSVQANKTAAAQFGAIKSTLSWLRANSSTITNTLNQPVLGSQYGLRSHYVTNTTRTMDMYHLDTQTVGPYTFTNFDTDDVNNVFTTCPLGYAVPTTNPALVSQLTTYLGIPATDGTSADKYTIETIHIDAADAWDSQGGVLADQDPCGNVTTTYNSSTKTGFTGYKLFFVSNSDGGYQLPFYLEPRAKYGLPRYRDYLSLPVTTGSNYSVLRLITKL